MKINYFSTIPLTERQVFSAAETNCFCGCAILINSAKSATLHNVSDISSKISTIFRFLFWLIASAISASVWDIAWSLKTLNPSDVFNSDIPNNPYKKTLKF